MNEPGPRPNTIASSEASDQPACASSDCTAGSSVAEAWAAPGPVNAKDVSPGTPEPRATDRVSVLESIARKRRSETGIRGIIREGLGPIIGTPCDTPCTPPC